MRDVINLLLPYDVRYFPDEVRQSLGREALTAFRRCRLYWDTGPLCLDGQS